MKSPFSARMKLKDYDGAIQFYSDLERQRPLTEQERDRLHELARRKMMCEAQARYRAKNKEKVKKAQEAWQVKNIKKRRDYSREWAQSHVAHVSARAKEWRAKNPDKVAAGKRRQKLLRDRDRFFREIGLALGCKVINGELVPLTSRQRKPRLMLPAPLVSDVFSLRVAEDATSASLGVAVPVVGLTLKAA